MIGLTGSGTLTLVKKECTGYSVSRKVHYRNSELYSRLNICQNLTFFLASDVAAAAAVLALIILLAPIHRHR